MQAQGLKGAPCPILASYRHFDALLLSRTEAVCRFGACYAKHGRDNWHFSEVRVAVSGR